ncbi:MAG: hypothetical protein DRN49_05950, partial [Thaumarchaeota archaeon]
VLDQLVSEHTIEFTSRLLSKGVLRLYPWSQSEEDEYLRLRSEIVSDPRIPSLERPDVLCLVMARSVNAVLLSENIGVHRVVDYHPRYRGLRVWTALEALENMVYENLISVSGEEEFLKYVREYEEDTAHIFKKKRVEDVLKRLMSWLRR